MVEIITLGDKTHAPRDEPQTLFPPKHALTLLEPQSHFGDKALKLQVVCPQNGTAVLKGLRGAHNENGGFGNISSIRLHRRIVGRIQYALPVAEKPRFKTRPRGCVILSP